MNDLTHISMLLDRSGSMGSIRDDVIGGINTFLKIQKDTPGLATFTLVQFDSQDPFEVIHDRMNIADVPLLDRHTFTPRGCTPLLDAIGKLITKLERGLANTPAELRPGKIVIAIVTDGQENASQRFSARKIRDMIRAKEELLGWDFVFLSSDLNAVHDSHHQGIAIEKSMLMRGDRIGEAMMDMSMNLRSVRSGLKSNMDWEDSDRAKHRAD